MVKYLSENFRQVGFVIDLWCGVMLSDRCSEQYRELLREQFFSELNYGWEWMEYIHRFEKVWGKGSYPPQTITLSQEDYDTLVECLNNPPQTLPSITDLLNRTAPWD
jgi:hypothetical protein